MESYGNIYKVLLFTIAPVIISTSVYNINQILDQVMFSKIMAAQGHAVKDYMALLGIYTGKYNTLINVAGDGKCAWRICDPKSCRGDRTRRPQTDLWKDPPFDPFYNVDRNSELCWISDAVIAAYEPALWGSEKNSCGDVKSRVNHGCAVLSVHGTEFYPAGA